MPDCRVKRLSPKRIDLAGQRFGRLVAIKPVYVEGKRGVHWECDCDCGGKATIAISSLRQGLTRSCRCLSSETTAARNRSHGKSKTPLYRIWAAMLNRCYNPKVDPYPFYGGRGIKVCDLWRHSFEEFHRDMGDRPPGRSLDRIDPDGPYSRLNCRWATSEVQARNKSRQITASLYGRRQTLHEWAAELGIPIKVLYGRIYAGHPDEKALTMPYKPGRPRRRAG